MAGPDLRSAGEQRAPDLTTGHREERGDVATPWRTQTYDLLKQLACSGQYYCAYSELTLRYDERPPSAAIVVPLTMRDSSEARKTAIAAMSSGSPTENG